VDRFIEQNSTILQTEIKTDGGEDRARVAQKHWSYIGSMSIIQ